MRYIVRLRRGRKYTDTNGNVIRDDWADYTNRQPVKAIPQAGELVLEYDNDVPRLKIGDGNTPFGSLEYMSIDSFILPKQKFVHLSTEWTKDPNHNDRYYQTVNVAGESITSKSKVDLHPTPEQLCEFQEKNLVLVAENSGGLVNVYCVGQPPANSYRIPVTVTEVVTNESVIIGSTTATPNYNPNWTQDDETKADYIKNKPIILSEEDVLELIKNNGGTGGTGVGVSSIDKTLSEGLIDTYTIYYTDGSTQEFVITNGADGSTPYIIDGYWCIDDTNTGVKAQGQDGKSAYEVACDNGYAGDVQSWLESLVGEKGDDGDDGKNGKSAYEFAQDGGYTGTQEEFARALATIASVTIYDGGILEDPEIPEEPEEPLTLEEEFLGTWEFKDPPYTRLTKTPILDRDGKTEVYWRLNMKFSSNGTTFNQIGLADYGSYDAFGLINCGTDTSLLASDTTFTKIFDYHEGFDSDYRRITITAIPTKIKFTNIYDEVRTLTEDEQRIILNWFKANATKVGSEPEPELLGSEFLGTWEFNAEKRLPKVSGIADRANPEAEYRTWAFDMEFTEDITNRVYQSMLLRSIPLSISGFEAYENCLRELCYNVEAYSNSGVAVTSHTKYTLNPYGGSYSWNSGSNTITITRPPYYWWHDGDARYSGDITETEMKAILRYFRANAIKLNDDSLATFSVFGTTYQCKKGMTWEDLIDSTDYNMDNQFTFNGECVMCGSNRVYANGDFVHLSDIIEDGYAYGGGGQSGGAA